MAAARKPLMAKATAITRLARTPSSRAMRKSSEAARIATPIGVRRRNTARSTSRARVTTIVTICSFGMRTSATRIGSIRPCHRFIVFGRPP